MVENVALLEQNLKRKKKGSSEKANRKQVTNIPGWRINHAKEIFSTHLGGPDSEPYLDRVGLRRVRNNKKRFKLLAKERPISRSPRRSE